MKSEKQLGYTEGVSDIVVLTLRKHRIGFQNGITARDLMSFLAHVPDAAIVDDVIGEVIVDATDDVFFIEFHEEKRAAVNQDIG